MVFWPVDRMVRVSMRTYVDDVPSPRFHRPRCAASWGRRNSMSYSRNAIRSTAACRK
jgi:hypothetical protein